ncbi:MAG: LlaJI family restriction endonuclease [Oscillospiraceae bacterium]|nr:LlaJI family restriction endonuclease [Oscillospiraceae bacterium]
MDEFFYREGDEFKHSNDNRFCRYAVNGNNRITAVGKIYTDCGLYYCMPKYLKLNADSDENKAVIKAHIELIEDVIRMILDKKKGDKRLEEIIGGKRIFSNIPNKSKSEHYVTPESLAQAIISDYINSGIYRYQASDTAKHKRGRIKWGTTVSRTQPLMINDNIIYTDVYRKRIYSVPDDEIAMLHCAILKRCAETAAGAGESISIPDDMPCIPDKMLDDAAHKERLKKAVEQRLRISYTDRDIFLLRALRAWLDQSRFYKEEKAYFIKSFDLFWEYLNDSVWGNIDNKNSDHPIYTVSESCINAGSYNGVGEQKPDTLHIFRHESELCAAIFDSKYYVPIIKRDQPNEISIVSAPPSTDINKQAGYKSSIRKHIQGMLSNIDKEKRPVLKMSNSFLMPAVYFGNDKILLPSEYYVNDDSCPLYEIRGHAGPPKYSSLDIEIEKLISIFPKSSSPETNAASEDDDNDIIDLCIVYPHVLYEWYLSERKVTNDEIYTYFIKK